MNVPNSHIIPFERSTTLNLAYDKIINEINAHGLTFTLYHYGTESASVHYCKLFNCSGEELATGCGKGKNPESSIVGALFESLEHYLYEHKCTDNLVIANLDKIKHQLHFTNDFVSDICAKVLKDQQGGMYKYQNYNENIEVLVPSILTCPRYLYYTVQVNDLADYSSIRRYASNSGTAIGINAQEALLHAINESIERDAISLFMIYHFYLNHKNKVEIINEDTLDHDIKERLSYIKTFLNLDIVILDVTSEFQVPVFIALPLNKEFDSFPLLGGGASLNKGHALERAISELVQMFLVYKNIPSVADDFGHDSQIMNKSPKLLNCFSFSIGNHQHILTDYKTIATYDTEATISAQLDTLTTTISKLGYHIYHRNIWQSSNVHCISVIIPELERFFLNMTGNPVIPSPKGISRATKLYSSKYEPRRPA